MHLAIPHIYSEHYHQSISSPYTEKVKSVGRVVGCQKDWVRVDELHGFSRHMLVPEGYCWVDGVGPVSMGLLRGKAMCYIWPLKSIKASMYKVPNDVDVEKTSDKNDGAQ